MFKVGNEIKENPQRYKVCGIGMDETLYRYEYQTKS